MPGSCSNDRKFKIGFDKQQIKFSTKYVLVTSLILLALSLGWIFVTKPKTIIDDTDPVNVKYNYNLIFVYGVLIPVIVGILIGYVITGVKA
jgi:hypothetical protein